MLFNTHRVGKNTALVDCVQSGSDIIIIIKPTAGQQEQISHKMYISFFLHILNNYKMMPLINLFMGQSS